MLTERDRKICEKAVKLLLMRGSQFDSVVALSRAGISLGIPWRSRCGLVIRYRKFWNIWDCPFISTPDTRKLQSTRALMMLTYLHLEGKL